MTKPIVEYVVTPHAAFVMKRRGIDDSIAKHVLTAPEQRAACGRDAMCYNQE